ncbi:MAG: hypothetical protein BGO49_28465 [Planctomycetales bacterium 71-10]|nr:MAG: hypothetical protein BGO49_28465 [Planctomycetales bacterium 71-10]
MFGSTLQIVAFGVAGVAMYRFAFGRRQVVEVAPGRRTVGGWLGKHVTVHLLVAMATGVLGPAFVKGVFAVLLIIPMMILEIDFELPDYLTAWPRAVAAKLQYKFRDKAAKVVEAVKDGKEAVGEKFEGVKEAVAEKIHGKKEDFASDEFWGGPADANASGDVIAQEISAFDGWAPERKLAMLDAAQKVPDSTTYAEKFAAEFEPEPLVWIRAGRSAARCMTVNELNMYRVLWTADAEKTAPSAAAARFAVGRLSTPSETVSMEEVQACLAALSATEKLAWLNAARRFKRPKDAAPSPTDPYCQTPRIGGITMELTKGPFEQLKEQFLKWVQEERAKEAQDKRDRIKNLAAAAKDKAQDASGFAKHAAADARDKAVGAVRDGVKDAAQGAIGNMFRW